MVDRLPGLLKTRHGSIKGGFEKMSYCQTLANKLNGHIKKLKNLIKLNNDIEHCDDLWKMLKELDKLAIGINKTYNWVWKLFKPYAMPYDKEED